MHEGEPILVLGGTGHYGQQIVRGLLDRGESVRVMTRNVPNARKILGERPELLKGDITVQESVASALEGTRAIVIAVAAHTAKSIRNRVLIERDSVLRLICEAERLSVLRVVYLSGYDVKKEFVEKLGLPSAFAKPMLDVQNALAASPLNWTVLGCPPSMEIFFAMIRGDRMNVPGGGPPALPTISPLDVGTIAAQAAVRDDLSGRHIRMPGPEALSFPDAARRISAVWGRPIRFRQIPLAPIKIASVITRPFFPFLGFLVASLKLLNGFPQEIASQVTEDHQKLLEIFNLTPTTLEMGAQRRLLGGS